LFELWNQVSVFYWQLNLSVECVNKHQDADRPFEIIWERMAILLGLCHDFINSCSKNLSLGIIGFGFLVMSSSRGEKAR